MKRGELELMSENRDLPLRHIRGNPEIQQPNIPRPPQEITPAPEPPKGKAEK